MFGIAENKEFLSAIGIANAPEDIKAKVIVGLEDLAQRKLTIKISDKLTDAQAEEFGAITDERQAYNWLITNVPNFLSLTVEVLEEMKRDILENRNKIVG